MSAASHPTTGSGTRRFARSVAFSAFTDVDEQARAFDGWSLNYTQISGGLFHGSSSIVSLGGIRLLVEHLDKVILQQGSVPSDRVAVAVPLELEGHARMCGEKSSRDSLHVFSSGPEFEFYSPDRHVLVNVEIEPDKLASEPMRALGASLLSRPMSPLIPMAADAADNLRQLLKQTLAASAQASPGEQADTDERIALLERTILYAISEAISVIPEAGSGNARPTKYWPLVNAVQDRLQDPATCPLSIAELCVQVGVSRRTLQYAFQEALNLNPIAYLRAVRLNHVRRDLRLGESVTSAATKWGFWHLSSFAHDYRVMFGELPSAASKRHARKPR
ncbi:AraC family transcriptional regulator [Caballeronia hypogeia]|uniref:AraC family transcriptional regulator n=1 Tax=Caballeronia hypogeia TaxID=1777140 RepID=A0A158CWE6_9BURK|nr:helix-turn-helix domain-containing protein [Caballeronia hypogeia]SAK86685.1 AraC family transcriptional regulator [Caballeronia hypogeia]